MRFCARTRDREQVRRDPAWGKARVRFHADRAAQRRAPLCAVRLLGGDGDGASCLQHVGQRVVYRSDYRPKTGQASSWRIPRDGAQGAQDLQEMFPPDVLAAFGSSDTETLNRVTAEMQSRCLAIASELGRMS